MVHTGVQISKCAYVHLIHLHLIHHCTCTRTCTHVIIDVHVATDPEGRSLCVQQLVAHDDRYGCDAAESETPANDDRPPRVRVVAVRRPRVQQHRERQHHLAATTHIICPIMAVQHI